MIAFTATMLVIFSTLVACNIGNTSIPTTLPLPKVGAENALESTQMPTDESPRQGQAIDLPPTWTPRSEPGQTPVPRPEQNTTIDTRQQSYIVQVGDTLAEIAIRFNVELDILAQANNIADQDHIEVGQELIIPLE